MNDDIKKKIDLLTEDLRGLADEIIDDLDLQHELENHYVVHISKELYDEYVKVLSRINFYSQSK